MCNLRCYHLKERFGQRQTVRSAALSVGVPFEIAVLFLTLLSVEELGHEVDTQILPIDHQVLCLRAGESGEESTGFFIVQVSYLCINARCLRVELIVPCLLPFADMRVHTAVLGVGPVGYDVKRPPCAGRGVGVTVSVPFRKALGDMVDATVHRGVARASCIVHTEPEDAITVVAAHL